MNALETLNLARRNGITPAVLHPLLALMSDPPMNPSYIAAICGISAAAITPSVDVLMKLGMVERVNSRKDRRTVELTPTEKALNLFEGIISELESTPR